MQELANADYIQHSPFIPNGLDPFIGLLPVLKVHGTMAENIRMFKDGDYVFMHNIWRNAAPFGADEMVSFDIIRVDENGKVAEHWDAMTPLATETASGRTQTDGPAKITDYISAESYAQHNHRADNKTHPRRRKHPSPPAGAKNQSNRDGAPFSLPKGKGTQDGRSPCPASCLGHLGSSQAVA